MQKNVILLAIIGLLIGGFVSTDKCVASPITIREVFAEAEAAAKSFADDAQLIFIFGRQIDSTGRSSNWGYYYESASLQERFEIPVNDGEVGQLHTNVDLPADLLPIGEQWIDSDSAVAEAEENGGQAFRETYEDASIEMYLQSEWVNATDIQSTWHILYISDAGGESFSYDVIAGEPVPDGEAPDEPAPEETTPEEKVLSTTARELFTDVNSAAQSVTDDVQLIFVTPMGQVDATGRSSGWSYVYESASLQEIYEFRVTDGEVRQLENSPFGLEFGPGKLPIPEEWMDSDAALAEAEENGGRDFRQMYDDAFIEMNLQSGWVNATEIQPEWHINYLSSMSEEGFHYVVNAGPSASILGNPLFEAPLVINVRFEQRTDGTGLVDIYYDLADFRACWLEIIIEASDDNGATWTLPCTNLTGDVGEYIAPGRNKHVVWDFSADNPDTSCDGLLVRVTALRMLCGQTITQDLTLEEDLTCPPNTGYAIVIGAPNVTLDLGGHTIYGDVPNDCLTAVGAFNVEGVTIRNGTLEGFLAAIDLVDANNALVEDMTIKNLDIADGVIHVTGIIVGSCQGVDIRDSLFEFLPVAHKAAVNMGSSHVDVNNIEVHDGSVGVDFGGASSGSVVNSRFIRQTIGGVLVQHCESARIANNVFQNSIISADAPVQGSIKGLIIEENDIHDCQGLIGIYFRGVSESIVSNNIVSNNRIGISLEPSRGCTGDYLGGEECFYATGNVITDNVVLGNNIDECRISFSHSRWRGDIDSFNGKEFSGYDPKSDT